MPTLTFDTTTPVAPKGLGGLTRDQFADGRITFASVSLRISSHLCVTLGGQQNGGGMLFNGHPLTGPVARIPFKKLKPKNKLEIS
jgi:hypothetical protein